MLSILLLEDNPDTSAALSRFLSEHDCTVKHAVGVRRGSACDFRVFLPTEGKPELKDHPWEEVDLSQFHVAIVDGMMIGKLYGWDVVPGLVRAHVICIAASSEDGLNKNMKAVGAQYSFGKERFTETLLPILQDIRSKLALT